MSSTVIDISKIKKTDNVLAVVSQDYPLYSQIIELLKTVSNSVTEDVSSANTFNHIVIVSGANITGFQKLFQQLKDGGVLSMYQSTPQNLMLDLLCQGFVDIVSSTYNSLGYTTANKPDWTQGTSDSVKIEPKSAGWGVVDNDATMDESELLSEADKNVKPSTSLDDCEVGTKGKKACKNCTCGRAELEAAGEEVPKPKLTKEMIENPGLNSNCGSCSLGDAFRCKGCPYRGLPAFKVGEKIVLPDDFLTDDI